MASIVTLLSGGLDSAAALAWAVRRWPSANHAAVFVDYGQPAREAEAKAFADVVERVSRHRACHVERYRVSVGDLYWASCCYRNLMLVAAAANRCPWLTDMVLGVQNTLGSEDEPHDDTTPPWVAACAATLEASKPSSPPCLHAPFQFNSKEDIFRYLRSIGLLSDFAAITYSCQESPTVVRGKAKPWGRGCGRCASCKARRTGYQNAIRG